MKVNLFIVGAPKCGTTALVDYLNQQNEIFFPPIKEPHYFCSDFPNFRRINDANQYSGLYNKSNARVKGDASVWYLYSKVSAQKIYEYNPEAKIIVMVRNPVDMLPSLHNQLLFSGREEQKSFDQAWSLIESRRQGRFLPKNVSESSHLFYDEVCDYHNQIKRYYDFFSNDQVKIVYFNDFIRDTKECVGSVVKWLGVEPRQEGIRLEKVNGSRVHAFPHFTKFIQHPPFPLNFIKDSVKKLPFVARNPILRPLYARLSRPISIEKPCINTIEQIKDTYRKRLESSEFLDQEKISEWFNQG